jgi:regulatory protein
MKVTEIRQQKNGRFAVYIDGEYTLSVFKDTLLESSFAKDCEVSQKELDAAEEKDNERKANERALTILSYRDHSKEELRRKLVRTVGEEEAQRAADHMEEIGLINDGDYAKKLAAELINIRLMGADRAVFEMKRRGISSETAREIVEEIDDDPQNRIERFIEKKYSNISDENVRRRATSALMRNGYRWDDIREVLDKFSQTD